MPSKQGRNFCFTINNYKENDIELLQSIAWIEYCIVGKEVGESGTPHLQGYLQRSRKIDGKATKWSGAKLNKMLMAAGVSSAHCQVAMGSPDANIKYCSKDDNVTEWGECAKAKGSRRDVAKFLSAAKEMTSAEDELKLSEDFPREYVKYYKAAERVSKLAKEIRATAEANKLLEGLILRTWQSKVRQRVLAQNDRKVTWCVDEEGGQGKSTLSEFMAVNDKAFLITNGKSADIAYAYNYEPVVIFDLTREVEERVNYQMIECFKNGRLFNSKYMSKTLRFPPCKVLVMSNWQPDRSKLSADRWDVVELPMEESAIEAIMRPKKRKRRTMIEEEEDAEELAETESEPRKKKRRRRQLTSAMENLSLEAPDEWKPTIEITDDFIFE